MRDRAAAYLQRYQELLRFAIAGGAAVAVNLTALYTFTDILDIHYLLSTVLAFLVAFVASFSLQKFWTFRDHSKGLHRQLPLYLAMQGANLGLNTLFMFILVRYFHIWYLLSQVLISLLLAFISFFINKRFIFTAEAR